MVAGVFSARQRRGVKSNQGTEVHKRLATFTVLQMTCGSIDTIHIQMFEVELFQHECMFDQIGELTEICPCARRSSWSKPR